MKILQFFQTLQDQEYQKRGPILALFWASKNDFDHKQCSVNVVRMQCRYMTFIYSERKTRINI